MSDQIEDDGFEAEDVEGEGFEDFQSGKSIGDVIRENPAAKFGLIGAGLVAVIGGMVLFGGGAEKKPSASMVSAGPEVKQAPGTTEVSEGYKERVEEQTQRRVEEAYKTGGSAMPTPISTARSELQIEQQTQDREDPLERWRKIQEERRIQDQQAALAVQAAPEDTQSQVVLDLSQAMSEQMQSILEKQNAPVKMTYLSVSAADYYEQKEKQKMEAAAQAAAASAATGAGSVVQEVVIPAGKIEYAQLLTEANSDVPGPILAQVVSGPLAGSRILGTFENKEDYLVLNFDTIVVDGISQSISAVAVNPDTAMIGMATEVDHRYFSRVILPAAASFVQGMSEGITDVGSTTTTSSTGGSVAEASPDLGSKEEFFKGVGEAAKKVGDLIADEAGDIKPLVRVAVGTPMGLLFTDPVTKAVE